MAVSRFDDDNDETMIGYYTGVVSCYTVAGSSDAKMSRIF